MPRKPANCPSQVDTFAKAGESCRRSHSPADPPLEDTAEGGAPRKKARTTRQPVPASSGTTLPSRKPVTRLPFSPVKEHGSSQLAPRTGSYNLRPRKPLKWPPPAASTQTTRQRSVKGKSPGGDTLPHYSAPGTSGLSHDFGVSQLPSSSSSYALRPRKSLVRSTPAGPSQRKRQRSVKLKRPEAPTSSVLPAVEVSRSSIKSASPEASTSSAPPAIEQREGGIINSQGPDASTSSVRPAIELSDGSSNNSKGPEASRVHPAIEASRGISVKFKGPETTTSLVNPPIELAEVQFLRIIGEGAFGKVWFTRLLRNNTACATKVTRRTFITDLQCEVECMKRVDRSFPFIVQFFGHFRTWKYSFLVMEYLGCGSLKDHLDCHEQLPESHARLYIAELGCALQHLHDRQVYHRDLNSDNVLFGADGHVKLIDFGVSHVIAEGEGDFSKDWYKLGLLLLRMVTGAPLSAEQLNRERIPIPEDLSGDCQNLLQQLLDKDPKSRLGGFLNLLGHPWFRGYNPEGIRLKLYKPSYIPSPRRTLQLSDFLDNYQHPDAKDYILTGIANSTFPLPDTPMSDAETHDSSDSSFDIYAD